MNRYDIILNKKPQHTEVSKKLEPQYIEIPRNLHKSFFLMMSINISVKGLGLDLHEFGQNGATQENSLLTTTLIYIEDALNNC
jgi:hypothetical protein